MKITNLNQLIEDPTGLVKIADAKAYVDDKDYGDYYFYSRILPYATLSNILRLHFNRVVVNDKKGGFRKWF